MRQDSALHRLAVDHRHILIGQEVESVEVVRVGLDVQILLRSRNIHNRLEQDAGAFLDKLSHRVQVGGKDCRRGVDALVVLAFALTKELFIPLGHHRESRLIADQNLDGLALAIQDVAQRRIAVAVVLVKVADAQILPCLGCALHELADVRTGHRNRQQSHRGQHRVASADVVRDDKGLIPFLVRQLL